MNELKLRFIVILNAAWRQRYVIVLPILLMPFAGYFVGKMAPAKYISHTSMLIQETAKMNPFLEDLAVSTMLKERLTALRTLLKSRHILRSVAAERGLTNDSMSPKQVDRVIAQLASSLTVTQPGKDFLKIQLTASKPDGMKELLESISEHFIEQMLAPERSSIKDSSEFLTLHIEKRRQALDEAETALANFKNENASVTPEMQNQSLTRLASLKQSLAEKEAELAGVERSLGSLDQQLSRTNPVVGKIEDQIIEIRSELSLLRAKYTDSHSAVVGKQRELRRLESERAELLSVEQPNISSEQLWDIASSNTLSDITKIQPLLVTQLHNLQVVRGKFESLSEETKSLKKMISDLELQANKFGDNAREIFQLQRDVKVKRQLYDELIQRYEMAQLTGSLGIFEQNKRVKIIDLPYTPSAPANLPVIIFIAAGLFAGIGLGCGIATVIELFNTSVRSPNELEALTGSQVIAIIPKIKPFHS
ncbi:chain-length determining protein [Vibrio sp. OCN044]|uniref:Chain-length determining protein n=1 Tax=Vibrio tetraodonis subsp. pristinus TaxID=2695891 RepID=A0A6L8LRE4_9VIBR|nr:GNVR domain-containing protein [Vibrio tetraodonis]MYM58661.1 chain-length determining protein [Vibrio tetraodonis subsp. pristinus]